MDVERGERDWETRTTAPGRGGLRWCFLASACLILFLRLVFLTLGVQIRNCLGRRDGLGGVWRRRWRIQTTVQGIQEIPDDPCRTPPDRRDWELWRNGCLGLEGEESGGEGEGGEDSQAGSSFPDHRHRRLHKGFSE